MRRLITGLLLAGLAPLLASITTPSPGAVLRGPVNITGSSQVETGGFSSSEVAFAFANDPTGTWFVIATSDQPVEEGTLATWDTTAITDGDYALRLRVYLQDGTTLDVTVTDLHVRNDLPLPTATPPVEAQDLPTFEPSLPAPTLDPVPVTPTYAAPAPLPVNPVVLTDGSVRSTFVRGAVFAVMAILLIGLFLRFRSSR
jgi:hypothetical protein